MYCIGLINPADSLFTYPPGTSAADFSFPDHIPLSVDEVVAGATEEVRESCEGNIKCIFDATQTGNMEIGLNTMQTEEVNMEDRMIACELFQSLESYLMQVELCICSITVYCFSYTRSQQPS